jgi:DMSO reductase anchor subunit
MYPLCLPAIAFTQARQAGLGAFVPLWLNSFSYKFTLQSINHLTVCFFSLLLFEPINEIYFTNNNSYINAH